MNWSIEEPTKEGLKVRPLHWSFHKTLALAVVEANLKHAPDVVTDSGPVLIFENLSKAAKPVAKLKP